MKNGAFLNVRAAIDRDAVVVAADHRPEPDADFVSKADVADHRRGRRNVGGFGDSRAAVAQAIDGHMALSGYVRGGDGAGGGERRPPRFGQPSLC